MRGRKGGGRERERERERERKADSYLITLKNAHHKS